MKRYQAKSLSLRYDPKQDRLQCICHCDQEQKISIWISRRILVAALPKIAQWLNQRSENEACVFRFI